MTREEAIRLVNKEYFNAIEKYGDFTSKREGLTNIWEEFEELKEAIFKHDKHNTLEEAIHLSAVVLKLITLFDYFD
ncbi:MAG TPA: hypothetical protein ENH75_06410 [archaeon]|nr:hypothetical protein [archaeon]